MMTDNQKVRHDSLDRMLHSAIIDGDVAEAKKRLKQGADINRTRMPAYGLHEAIGRKTRSLEMVKLLLENGADINRTHANGDDPADKTKAHRVFEHPLQLSIFDGSPEITRYLLSHAQLDLMKAGEDALSTALWTRQEDIAFEVIAKGPEYSIDRRSDWLMKAAEDGCARVFMRLAEQGHSLDVTREERLRHRASHPYRQTLMQAALIGGNTEILDYLHSQGISFDDSEIPSVYFAILKHLHGAPDSISWLARHGADLDLPFEDIPGDGLSLPAIHHCATNDFGWLLDCFKQLLEAGADTQVPKLPISAFSYERHGSDRFPEEYQIYYREGPSTLEIAMRLGQYGDLGDEGFLPFRDAYSAHVARVEAEIGQLKQNGFQPADLIENGKPTLALLRIAALGKLPEIFRFEHWNAGEEKDAAETALAQNTRKARELFSQMQAALPSRYRTHLEAVDLHWAAPESVGSWAVLARGKPERLLRIER